MLGNPINYKMSKGSSADVNVTPDFTFTSCDIGHIPKMYSTYPKGNEVPDGSLAMIGYMMGYYGKDGELVGTPNLNWVVVITADD